MRVPLTTMPLATNALLDVAAAKESGMAEFEPGSQIRLSVPEPRQAVGESDHSDIGSNYAVVDGELQAGTRQLTERVMVAGREFSPWWMPMVSGRCTVGADRLGQSCHRSVRGEMDVAISAVLWICIRFRPIHAFRWRRP